jgi:uncharacterized membrane protein
VLFAVLGLLRFRAFHNETFDLALYTRMAWGLARAEFWDPIVNAHVYGIHLSPVLVPLGWVGLLFPTPEVLVVAQGAALGASLWPLARMAERRLGPGPGVAFAAGTFLLYPSVVHVASYEFHPGTLAVLPLAWMLDALDDARPRVLIGAAIGVLLCREDLGLVTMAVAVLAWRTPGLRRSALTVGLMSVVWVAFFALYLQPHHAPAAGSLHLHFGKWGDSIPAVFVGVLTDPQAVAAHLGEQDRLVYLAALFAPLAFLPLVRPRSLVAAVPVLGINLLSNWPTTTDLDSHYQMTLVPILVAAAIDGAGLVRTAGRVPTRWLVGGTLGAAVVCHLAFGGSPLAAGFDWDAVRFDERSAAGRTVVESIPADASVQAPYALMPHLAERMGIARVPPPDRNFDYVVLDAWHRDRYAHREDLLRTTEEPPVRDWLARDDYGLVRAAGPYLVLARGSAPREGVGARYLTGTGDPYRGIRLAACLRLLGATLVPEGLAIDVVATSACPSDLAVRIGSAHRPRRVDLLFSGHLSPAHLRAGDRARSLHVLTPRERAAWAESGVYIGLLRSSGARPEHADPTAVYLPLEAP